MQLDVLQPVFTVPGPYVTVCLDVTRADENAAHEIELRWRALRGQLAGQGVPEDLLEALQAAALEPTGRAGRHGKILVGAGGQVVFNHPLPHPPQPDLASYDAVPHLMPFVRQHAFEVPHVLVVADRAGADITVYGPLGDEAAEENVEGSAHHLATVPTGGWSQRRYQQHAENLWSDNAEPVAKEIDRLVARTAARLVAVAGDVRALAALRDRLGERASSLVVELDAGSRGAGSDEEALHEELARAVRDRAVAAADEVVELFTQERGRHGLAVEGLADVVDALRKAQVDTVLLHDDPNATTELWVSEEPLVLGIDEEDVLALGAEKAERARADAAVLRALAASDAAVVVVPTDEPAIADGIGATLRYADASTPSA